MDFKKPTKEEIEHELRLNQEYDSEKRRLAEKRNIPYITDYSQIQNLFEKIYSEITPQKFNAKINIVKSYRIGTFHPENQGIHRKGFLWFQDYIAVKTNPISEVFYFLAHEAGHATKPFLGNLSLDQEEVKATLFQNIFSRKLQTKRLSWIEDLIALEMQIHDLEKQTHSDYYAYQKVAEKILEDTDDFEKGVKFIPKMLNRFCTRTIIVNGVKFSFQDKTASFKNYFSHKKL